MKLKTSNLEIFLERELFWEKKIYIVRIFKVDIRK